MKRANDKTGKTDRPKAERPDVFRYHDYRQYLKDWVAYRRSVEKGFSTRKLAQLAALTPGFLSLVFSGDRALSANALAKLMPVLGLGKSERSFLEAMHLLGTSDSHEVRLDALNRMGGFAKYAANHLPEAETYQYLTHWYHVAIRELATDPAFKADPEWIRERLRVKVPASKIQEALDFLLQHQYLTVDADGRVRPPEKNIEGVGGVYRISLAQFHRQMFRLAEESLENARDTERNVMGHTFTISQAKVAEVREVINAAVKKVQAIAEAPDTEKKENVYHLELALFPLTKSRSKP